MLRILSPAFGLALAFSCQSPGSQSDLTAVDALACPVDPASDSCQLYSCLEIDHQCGEDGYPTQFGAYYCERFLGLCEGALFGEAEKQWARATNLCLQTSTHEAQVLENTCSTIEAQALKSHAYCFTKGAITLGAPDLCSLGPSAWKRIRGCFDRQDRLSRKAVHQLGESLLACIPKLKGGLAEHDSIMIPDETILGEWADEASTLGQTWIKEAAN